jgi:hypothetical protein
MRKLLMASVAVAALASGSAQAEAVDWVPISAGSGQLVYISKRTTAISKTNVTYWFRSVRYLPTDGTRILEDLTMRVEANCKSEATRVLAAVGQQNGQDLEPFYGPGAWVPSMPGTVGRTAFDIACASV